jgi:uncharacterized protein (DUF362 family)
MKSDGLTKKPLYVCRANGALKSSVYTLLDAAGLSSELEGREQVLIKPNLVGTHKPPITTPFILVEAIADYILEKAPGTKVLVGDGTGSLEYDTWRCFEALGYLNRAGKKDFHLVDLNTEELVRLEKAGLARWSEFFIPKVVMESYLISVPVLKAHTLSDVTLTMKNMIGVAPPSHYQQGGHWKKSSFHTMMHESIFDLNMYRTPDFTVLDATAGMKEAHLWGPTMSPAPGLLVAGYDPVATDAYGADLLGKDYNQIRHIRMADGLLGHAEPSGIEEFNP